MFFRFVETSTTGVVQTFGRFSRLASPGLRFYIPFVEKITLVSNRLQQNSVYLQVKTKDNVLTNLGIDVQYRIRSEDATLACFSLVNPIGQMDAFVKNVVRARVPKMLLDELFESPDEISNAISEQLAPKMRLHGYTIENTLLTAIDPDKEVMTAMNRINASARLKDAAKNEADAEYIKTVKIAEADRDRKRLQGEGISQQRIEIMKGYQKGVSEMAHIFSMDHRDIVQFVLKTQYLDTMENIGKANNTKTLFLNNSLDPKINPFFINLVASKETD